MKNYQFEKFDMVKGVVTANLRGKGCFIETENGTVFLPKNNFKTGTHLIGTVFKVSSDKYPLISLDSVIYDAA